MATQSHGSGFVETAQNNLKDGAIVGGGAYLATYIVMFVFTAIDGLESTGEAATWKAVGWVFYGSHMVDLELSALGQTQTFDIFESTSTAQGLTSTIPGIGYKLVPVIVLLIAGYVLYQRAGARLDTGSAAGLGATAAAGYFVLAVVGIFLFEYSASGASIAPKMTTGIAIAGLAYPIVLGAIGAVAASES
jgi:hypothetical protein